LRNVHAMKLYFKNFEIYHNISIYSQLPPIQYFLGAAAEPLGSAREALRAPRSTGWEPLPYRKGFLLKSVIHYAEKLYCGS